MCSQSVVITWSPGRMRPLMAMFRASVELAVKMTWSGRGQPKSLASFTRVLYTVRDASRAPPWAPRAALPMAVMARTTASMTWGGLCSVVAALSR